MFDDKYRSKLPQYLQPAENDVQKLKYSLRQFLSLRYMISHIRRKETTESFSKYPFKTEERNVDKWNIGSTVEAEINSAFVLCNLLIDNELEVRYVV